MSAFLDSVKERAKQDKKTIVLPESMDRRTFGGAAAVLKEGLANLVIIGNPEEIAKNSQGLDVSGAVFVDPATYEKTEAYINKLVELRQKKGMTYEMAKDLLLHEYMYFACMMVKMGDADGLVSGAIHSTGDMLRPALQIIKTAPGIKVVSSCFIMELPDPKWGDNGVMIFGDCAVIPNPTAEELAAIAIASAASGKQLVDINPRVAMLSFSTKGSAKHENVTKVQEATRLAHELAPDLQLDGELQADAALVESVGQLKSPGSTVAGHANVLVFPDLQAGNIGYKLVQRLAGAEAIGPIIQGLAKPVSDLSRGCSVDDIVSVVSITAVKAQA